MPTSIYMIEYILNIYKIGTGMFNSLTTFGLGIPFICFLLKACQEQFEQPLNIPFTRKLDVNKTKMLLGTRNQYFCREPNFDTRGHLICSFPGNPIGLADRT